MYVLVYLVYTWYMTRKYAVPNIMDTNRKTAYEYCNYSPVAGGYRFQV